MHTLISGWRRAGIFCCSSGLSGASRTDVTTGAEPSSTSRLVKTHLQQVFVLLNRFVFSFFSSTWVILDLKMSPSIFLWDQMVRRQNGIFFFLTFSRCLTPAGFSPSSISGGGLLVLSSWEVRGRPRGTAFLFVVQKVYFTTVSLMSAMKIQEHLQKSNYRRCGTVWAC